MSKSFQKGKRSRIAEVSTWVLLVSVRCAGNPGKISFLAGSAVVHYASVYVVSGIILLQAAH